MLQCGTKECEVKRKYSLVSGCLVVVLGCMCCLSACGEPAQNSGTAVGSVKNGTNRSRTVTIREAAIACNIPEWQVSSGYLEHTALSYQEYVEDPGYVDDSKIPEYSRENSSRLLHSLTKVVPCVIKELNPDDPKALELASKVERTFSKYNPDNLNDYFKENDLSFINYVGRSYVITSRPYRGIEFHAFSVDDFNKLNSKMNHRTR